MRAVWITKKGGYDVLQVRETPDPVPKAGEVKVRVKAAGLNFAEVMARQGMYPDAPRLPTIVGYEAAGVIEALGEGVTGLSIGQRVMAMPYFGGHSDVVVPRASEVIPMPEKMSFEEGAALPVTYLTAYHMLFRSACVRPGESILIHAAAGGVGLAMLQLCKTIENLTIFGTASKGKHEIIKGLGVTHAIDYHSADYAAEVLRLTSGKGVDAVFDSLGGKDWSKGFKLLRPAGRLVCFGFSNMSGARSNPFKLIGEAVKIPFYNPMKLMDQNKSVVGVNMGHLWDETALLRSHMAELVKLYEAGIVKPHIDSTFSFDKAGDAHRRIEERKNVGKVLLLP